MSYGKNCVFDELLETYHYCVLGSPVIPGLMAELTNEGGFACLGLPLSRRLICLQYAKLLTPQDFIQAPPFLQ